MYKHLQIKDIYVGNIDAKDDFERKNLQFRENFYIPDGIDIKDFLNDDTIFIEGLKGTGKTALLYFLKNNVDDNNAPNEIILFKSDYDDIKKEKLSNVNDNFIRIDKDSDLNVNNFRYLWEFILLSKILKLNVDSNYSIYKKTDSLEKLMKLVKELVKINTNKKSIMSDFFNHFKAISLSTKYDEIQYALTLNFSNMKDKLILNDSIYECMNLFKHINEEQAEKTAYIFIDELEAYFERDEIFKRDLTLIRDLIFTVKDLSKVTFNSKVKNIKFICAVRSEILFNIESKITSKEINKAIYSFKYVLKWNYPYHNAINHPIIKIWLKRIETAEKNNGNIFTLEQIYDKWFVKKVHDQSIEQYIIHRTWNKPRDIIRFMSSARNVGAEETKYHATIFTNLNREYSKESWNELSEELNATFTKIEINQIKSLFTGFISPFNYKQIFNRANSQSEITGSNFLTDNISKILETLFRVGVIGNLSKDKKNHRWNHKGDESLIIQDENFLMEIHFALHNELTITRLGANTIAYIELETKFKGEVIEIKKNFIRIKIEENDLMPTIYINSLLISASFKVNYLRNYYDIGQIIYVKVVKDPNRNTNRLIEISVDEYHDTAIGEQIDKLIKHYK